MIHRSSCRQYHLIGTVIFPNKLRQIRFLKLSYPFLRPQDRAPDGLTWIGDLLQPIEDNIIRRIQSLTNLRQDHATFDFNLSRVKNRIEHNI